MQEIELLWLNVAIARQEFWFFLKPYTIIKKKMFEFWKHNHGTCHTGHTQ